MMNIDGMESGSEGFQSGYTSRRVSDARAAREPELVLHGLQMILVKDPVGSVDRFKLVRAFTIWQHKWPLTQKCDELGRQMQERMLALNKVRHPSRCRPPPPLLPLLTAVPFPFLFLPFPHHTQLRDSYLRDVITVKYTIDRLAKYGEGEEEDAQQEMAAALPALAAVPSMDLRPLIERAKQSVKDPSSAQLKETMLQVRHISPLFPVTCHLSCSCILCVPLLFSLYCC